MSFTIHLPVFEGPLDLLLFFIKRDEIDIYDIPIAKITRDYMDYIQTMQSLNVQLAGEFISMAATLMRIKAQTLLPRPGSDSGEEIEDPRTELTRMLLEYQRFKEVAENLKELEKIRSEYFTHLPAIPEDWVEADTSEIFEDITLYQMMESLRSVLDSMPKPTYYELEKLNVTIQEKTDYLLSILAQKKEIKFSEIAQTFDNRIHIIVTFLACLELAHMQRIKFVQYRPFTDFRIKSKEGE